MKLRERVLSWCGRSDDSDRESCWWWLGSAVCGGYGRLQVNGRIERAHRVAFREWRGEIPDGMVLDHLCRNRACVNPWHLRVVTIRENVMCGVTEPARNRAKTHCKHGHPFDGDNLRIVVRGAGYRRECRACTRRNLTSNYQRHREDRLAYYRAYNATRRKNKENA